MKAIEQFERRIFVGDGDGDGTYEVRLIAVDRDPFDVYDFEIVASTNTDHPVGARRSAVVSRNDLVLRDAEPGTLFSLTTKSVLTEAGWTFTRHSFAKLSDTYLQMRGRAARELQPEIGIEQKYGATCKRCNEHNPHAEARPDFVCFGCR